MNSLAKKLGVKDLQEFTIKHKEGAIFRVVGINMLQYNVGTGWHIASHDTLFKLLCNHYMIERKEPKLKKIEIMQLKILKEQGFEYITRDKTGRIFAYSNKPTKVDKWGKNGSMYFELFENMFDFITYYDNESTSIEELLLLVKKSKK